MNIKDVKITPSLGRKRLKATACVSVNNIMLRGIKILKHGTEYSVSLPSKDSLDAGLVELLADKGVRRLIKETVVNEYILFMIERTSAASAVAVRMPGTEDNRFMYAEWVHL